MIERGSNKEHERTDLLGKQALDFALFERLDEASFRREIDDFGIRIAEVELQQQVVCDQTERSSAIIRH
jgi:hypothetical protein